MSRQRPPSRQLTIFDYDRAHPAEDSGQRSVTYPGKGFRPDLKHGLVWCPYCAMTTLFAWDYRLKEPRCPRCSIGAGDYYVAHINHLDTDAACEEFARAVRRAGLLFNRPLFFEKAQEKKDSP